MKKNKKLIKRLIIIFLCICFFKYPSIRSGIISSYYNIKNHDVISEIKHLEFGTAIRKMYIYENYNRVSNTGSELYDGISIEIILFEGKCTDDEVVTPSLKLNNFSKLKFRIADNFISFLTLVIT